MSKKVAITFGHYGEASPDVQTLLVAIANVGARRHWRAMRAASSSNAVGALVWMMRRRWGLAAWRANARLLLDRLEYVGAGAAAAVERRVVARAGAAQARQAAYAHVSRGRHRSAGERW